MRGARINWCRWDRLLGTMPDTDLAERIGCHPRTVYRRRQELGVTAWGRSHPAGEAFSLPALARHSVHQRLVAAFQQSRLSVDDLAEAVGTSPRTVARWLAGTNTPSFPSLLRLAVELTIEPGDLTPNYVECVDAFYPAEEAA